MCHLTKSLTQLMGRCCHVRLRVCYATSTQRSNVIRHSAMFSSDTNHNCNNNKMTQQPCRRLATDYKLVPINRSKMVKLWASLAKSRLTVFVSGTALGGYVAAYTHSMGEVIPSTFLVGAVATAVGTALCSASANSFNHMFESPYDAQTSKQDRPFPSGAMTYSQGFGFALGCGVTGVGVLAAGANIGTAALGLSNILLYAWLYTSHKRVSTWNTWTGAVVGAIPPLMGWVAAMGVSSVACWEAWLLPLFVFSWQFPHFNAISWKQRSGYGRAGYPMMSVTEPEKAKRVALRHAAIILFAYTPLVYTCFAPTYWIAVPALANLHLLYYSWKFTKFPTEKAGILMLSTFVNLPAVMLLIIFYPVWCMLISDFFPH